MNHVPYPYISGYGDVPVAVNPVPGRFHPRVHGTPVVHALLEWCDALRSGDQARAATTGAALLSVVHLDGASAEVTGVLQEKMQTVIYYVQSPEVVQAIFKAQQPGGGRESTDDTSPADGFDLYQPDPDMFYVLDKRSGVELDEVRVDLLNLNRYIKRKAPAPARLLFVGPPGCGKTVGGRWLATQVGMPLALVRIDSTVSSAVGGTAKKLRAAFEYARDNRVIVFVDEFEAVAVPRNNQGANVGQWSREQTSALLQLLDSLPKDQIVIGATNHLELVDGAVAERMWKHVRFHPPDREARAAMLRDWWSDAPHHDEAKRVLLDRTAGCSGRTLERFAHDANRSAARRAETAHITVEDVELAVARASAPDPNVRIEDFEAVVMRLFASTAVDHAVFRALQSVKEAAKNTPITMGVVVRALAETQAAP